MNILSIDVFTEKVGIGLPENSRTNGVVLWFVTVSPRDLSFISREFSPKRSEVGFLKN